jgi:hypothetical protein
VIKRQRHLCHTGKRGSIIKMFLPENLKQRDKLRNLEVGEKIILKLVFWMWI